MPDARVNRAALRSAKAPMPAALAAALVEELRRRLRVAGRRCPRLRAVGSLRRREPVVKDLDLLVVLSRELGDVRLTAARAADLVTDWALRSSGPRRSCLSLKVRGRARRVQADLFRASRAELPYALYHYTGSRGYNIRIRAHAKRRGWRLNQYGLFDRAGRRVAEEEIRTEKDLARIIGVTYRRPQDRLE